MTDRGDYVLELRLVARGWTHAVYRSRPTGTARVLLPQHVTTHKVTAWVYGRLQIARLRHADHVRTLHGPASHPAARVHELERPDHLRGGGQRALR